MLINTNGHIYPIFIFTPEQIGKANKYNKNTTLNEFIKYYNELFKVEIEMILYETAIIYAEFLEHHLDIQLSELFLKEFNIDISKIEISVTIMGSADIPNINILLE
jgi:hypothetical protein